jgi:MFS family permease
MGKSTATSTIRAAGTEPSVATPLLPGHTTAHDHHDHDPQAPTIHHDKKKHPQFLTIVAIILTSLFLIAVGDFMIRAPWMRIQEDVVCRSYYTRTFPSLIPNPGGPLEPIPEDRCKVPDVQSKLAMLRGWHQTISCVPSILTAVPYGVAADKYGRKVVLILCLTGIVLSLLWAEAVGWFSGKGYLAIEWLWAGNMFLFIGGGPPVSRSMFFTILADIASEEVRRVHLIMLRKALMWCVGQNCSSTVPRRI